MYHFNEIIELFTALPAGVTHDDIIQEISGANIYQQNGLQYFEIVLENGYTAKGQYFIDGNSTSHVYEVLAGAAAYETLIIIFEYKHYQKKHGKES